METVSLAAISRVELEEFVYKEDPGQWVQTSVDVHVMYYPAAPRRRDVTSVTGLMLNINTQPDSQPASMWTPRYSSNSCTLAQDTVSC